MSDEQRTGEAQAPAEKRGDPCGVDHSSDACQARKEGIDAGLAIGLGIDTRDMEGHRFYTLDELCRVRAFTLDEGMERGAAVIVGVTGMGLALRAKEDV